MTHRVMAIPLFFLASIAAHPQASRDTSVRPTGGFVPHAKTAEKIAEAVLIPVYGEEQISRERPFKRLSAEAIYGHNGHAQLRRSSVHRRNSGRGNLQNFRCDYFNGSL